MMKSLGKTYIYIFEIFSTVYYIEMNNKIHAIDYINISGNKSIIFAIHGKKKHFSNRLRSRISPKEEEIRKKTFNDKKLYISK